MPADKTPAANPPGGDIGPWQRPVTRDPLGDGQRLAGQHLIGLPLADAHHHIARAAPEHPAVIDATGTMTHGALEASARHVAAALRTVIDDFVDRPADESTDPVTLVADRGLVGVVGVDDTGTPVGTPTYVLCDHDATAVVATLGVAAAGATHLVLDHRAPPAHRAAIITRHGAGPVVCSAHHADEARRLAACPGAVVVVESPCGGGMSAIANTSLDPTGAGLLMGVHDDVSDHAPLMVSSTSGTSGVPKAVVHSHRTMVANAVRFAAATNLSPADRVAVSLPFAFAASGTPTHAALLAGATAVVVDPTSAGAPGLVDTARDHDVTVMFLTAGLIDHLGRHRARPVSTVRLVVTGGDRLNSSGLRTVAGWFPNATVLHRYNTSETLWATGLTVDPTSNLPDGPVPIGWPVPWIDTKVTPDGELVVTGDHLALGYLNDAARTAARFTTLADGHRRYRTGDLVAVDINGCLTHRGRLDTTVKVGGILVDPVGVEHAITGLGGVTAAAVVPVTDDAGTTRLAGWVVGTGWTPRLVRRALNDVLPRAMIPATITMADQLPLTAMGKVDGDALVAADRPTTVGAGGPPVTDTEELVATAFGAVLAIESVGRLDDVFELGADSLDAVEIATRLTSAVANGPHDTSTTVDVPDLIDHPTAATMATWLAGPGLSLDHRHHPRLRQVTTGNPDLPPLVMFSGGGGGRIASMAQLARAIGTHEAWVVAPRGFTTRALPDRTIEAQAATVVADITQRWPNRAVALVSYSAGGVVAGEVARRLCANHTAPAAVVIINGLLPNDTERRYHSAPAYRQRAAQRRIDDGRPITALHHLWWMVGTLKHKIFKRWRRYSAGIIVRPTGRQQRVFAALTHSASSRHYPTALHCDVTLVRASVDTDGFARAPRDLHWGSVVTGNLQIVDVPGDHNQLLTGAHLVHTASAVSCALALAATP